MYVFLLSGVVFFDFLCMIFKVSEKEEYDIDIYMEGNKEFGWVKEILCIYVVFYIIKIYDKMYVIFYIRIVICCL